MSAVLRHDHDFKSNCHSNNIACVDKDHWMQSVIWPVADFTRWLARLLYFTKHFRTWDLRKTFDECKIFKLRVSVTNADWDNVDIPPEVAIKWLAICTFDKPRCATLCTTKFNSAGKVEVDRTISFAAIQCHTVVEANSFRQLPCC